MLEFLIFVMLSSTLFVFIFYIVTLDYCLYPDGFCDLVMDLWHVNK
jgi:hypothetical protein